MKMKLWLQISGKLGHRCTVNSMCLPQKCDCICEKGPLGADQNLIFWYQIVAHIKENRMELKSN